MSSIGKEESRGEESGRESDITMLFKMYDQSWAQARHMDEYMERIPRFFLIVVGAVIACLVQSRTKRDSNCRFLPELC